MKILAFDTSGKATAIALACDDERVMERNFVDEVNHSVSLMPTIDEMMREARWQPSALTRVVVAQGPGSYTGLRIAVTCAKTLAWTLGCELVGLSSLAVLAESAECIDTLVVPLMNARRGFVYAGLYQNGFAISPDRHCQLTHLLEELSKDTVTTDTLMFVGETADFEKEIHEKFPKAAVLEQVPKGAALIRLGKDAQPVKDSYNFNPIYLKKVEAEEKWEAANGITESSARYVHRV